MKNQTLTYAKVVDAQPKSRMWYRIGATRSMTGGRKIQPALKMTEKLKEVSEHHSILLVENVE